MSDIFQILLLNFVVLMSCMIVLWLISIPLRDVSFVDAFWAAGFVIVAAVVLFRDGIEHEKPRPARTATDRAAIRFAAEPFNTTAAVPATLSVSSLRTSV